MRKHKHLGGIRDVYKRLWGETMFKDCIDIYYSDAWKRIKFASIKNPYKYKLSGGLHINVTPTAYDAHRQRGREYAGHEFIRDRLQKRVERGSPDRYPRRQPKRKETDSNSGAGQQLESRIVKRLRRGRHRPQHIDRMRRYNHG